MKPLISIDLTNDKNNLIMNGTQFIVATPSDVLHQRLEKSIDEAFVEALKQSLVFNLKKKTIIHTDTLKAWNWMCLNNRRENI